MENNLLCAFDQDMCNQGYQVLSGEDKNHSSQLILSNHYFFDQIMHHVQVINKNLLSKSMKAS